MAAADQVAARAATPDYLYGLGGLGDKYDASRPVFVFALQNAPTFSSLEFRKCRVEPLQVGIHRFLPPIRRFYSCVGCEVCMSLAMEYSDDGLAYHLEAVGDRWHRLEVLDDMIAMVTEASKEFAE